MKSKKVIFGGGFSKICAVVFSKILSCPLSGYVLRKGYQVLYNSIKWGRQSNELYMQRVGCYPVTENNRTKGMGRMEESDRLGVGCGALTPGHGLTVVLFSEQIF